MKTGTEPTKLNWKHRIILAILSGVLFIGFLMIFNYLKDDKLFNTKSILAQGVIFGIINAIGLPYISKKSTTFFNSKIGNNINPELTKDENIEDEGPANLFRGLEGVGGKLFLTNKKIIFKSHNLNIQRGQTDIPYKNITEIIERKTGKLIDNGIRIKTNDGKEFDFVVNDRKVWIEKINIKRKA